MKGLKARGEIRQPVPRVTAAEEGLGEVDPDREPGLEEWMSEQAFRESMRSSLHALKERMLEELVHHSHEFRELSENMQTTDLADIASEDIERHIVKSWGYAERRRSVQEA